MKKIILYSYSKCSTCRKALKWLDQKFLEYHLIDIVKTPPSEEFLYLALNQNAADKKKVFNTRGKTFKLIDFDINKSSNEEIIQLLSSDGKLIKRPFLIYEEEKIILGFSDSEYNNYFAKH